MSKQTAVYSLQRKLKTCKQSILSKELQVSLLQKKVEALEQSSKSSTHMERDLEEASKKVGHTVHAGLASENMHVRACMLCFTDEEVGEAG